MIDDLRKEIESIKEKLINEIEKIQSLEELQLLRDKYLSRKKGMLTSLMTKLKELPNQDKPVFGNLVNSVKKFTEEKIKESLKNLPEV